jgi:PhzF family phenazine biosynthesis protein
MTSTFPFFQVDAFAPAPLKGNPAGVVPLEQWLPDSTLRAIAAEVNTPETAFAVPLDGGEADYHLRWFTPTVEVDLCGHATLASAHIFLTGKKVRFSTRSGILSAERDEDGLLWIDLPAVTVEPSSEPELLEALGIGAVECWRGFEANGSRIALLSDEAAVRAVKPDFVALAKLDSLAIVTAPGDRQAIVSRVFAAPYGVPEDPVTGAAHCALVPFWAKRLGRSQFGAVQASERGGLLECRLDGDRVKLGGRCFTVIEGNLQI